MVVLSYETAKKSLLFLAIYMIIIAFLFKGITIVGDLGITFISSTLDSLLNGEGFSFKIPDFNFNFDSLSFDGIKVYLVDSLRGFLDNMLALTIGFMNIMGAVTATSYVYKI